MEGEKVNFNNISHSCFLSVFKLDHIWRLHFSFAYQLVIFAVNLYSVLNTESDEKDKYKTEYLLKYTALLKDRVPQLSPNI